MAKGLREIRQKMKGYKSTRQVTKAMELISASKMRKAVQNAQSLRRYALNAWEILLSIGKVHAEEHVFLRPRAVQKVLGIIFTSDRGMCGSLNALLLRATQQYLRGVQELSTFEKIDFITVGRRGNQAMQRQGHPIIANFPALSNNPSFRDVLPITRLAIDSFISGEYDHVVLIYTDFISPLIQEPTVKVLLPFSRSEMRDMTEGLQQQRRLSREEQELLAQPHDKILEYRFEPSPTEVLDIVMPQLTEVQVYQAVLEAVASEHSARMIAMRNATDNASSLLDDLTLVYNSTRQANITAELAELSASKAALD